MCTPRFITKVIAVLTVAMLGFADASGQSWEEPHNSLSIWPGEYFGTKDSTQTNLVLYPDLTFHLSRWNESSVQNGRGNWKVTADSLYLTFNTRFYFQSSNWEFSSNTKSSDSEKTFMVRDGATKEPIPGAQITFQGSSLVVGGITKIDGTTTVLVDPSAAYRWVIVEFVGYTPVRIDAEKAFSKMLALEVEMVPDSNIEIGIGTLPIGHRALPPRFDMGFSVKRSDGGIYTLSSGTTVIELIR